ncbi:MAG TPA: hypothetical protein VIN37_02985 [Candidatus Limnocylindria bacterium]
MTTMWILGFIAGLAAVVVINFMFVLGVAIVVIVSLIRPRPAAAAGVCVAWGAGFLIVMRRAVERCLEFDRQPNAACTMPDNTPFAIAGIAVLVLGLALTLYVAWRARAVAVPSSS